MLSVINVNFNIIRAAMVHMGNIMYVIVANLVMIGQTVAEI